MQLNTAKTYVLVSRALTLLMVTTPTYQLVLQPPRRGAADFAAWPYGVESSAPQEGAVLVAHAIKSVSSILGSIGYPIGSKCSVIIHLLAVAREILASHFWMRDRHHVCFRPMADIAGKPRGEIDESAVGDLPQMHRSL